MAKEKLSPKRELFCKMYTSKDVEMFGNGVQSYIEVYNPDESKPNWYKTACQSAYQILSNIDVIERINELLEEQGFNDQNVEKQHLFILNQHVNIPAKMKAIDSYYKLKGKNEPEKREFIVTEQDKDKANNAIDKFLNGNKENTTRKK